MLALFFCLSNAAFGAPDTRAATTTTTQNTASNSVTFFVVSDLHYDWPQPGDYTRQRTLIEQMNATPGLAFPVDIGGSVATPRGVLVLGDITESVKGQVLEAWQKDWGMTGEGLLRFPVYEGLGNHDAHSAGSWVMEKARNEKRPGLDAVSTNGYHYSWTWNGIHFVMLNLCAANPETGDRPGAAVPRRALDFLVDDLRQRVGESGQPVILLQHFGVVPWGQWTQPQIDECYAAIKAYNIICLMHGHDHTAKTERWHEIDVLDDGSFKKDANAKAPPCFFVVRIEGNQLTAVERDTTGQWGKVRLQKTFSLSKSAHASVLPKPQP